MNICGNASTVEDIRKFREKARQWQRKDKEGLRTLLYMTVQYIVVPQTGSDGVSESQIQALHGQLRTIFNSDPDTSSITTSSRYPYSSKLVNPKITILPATVSESAGTIDRLSSRTYDAFSSVSSELKGFYTDAGHSFKSGTVYIFIADTATVGEGQILGVAEDIPSANLLIHPGTVGSVASPGSLGEYGQGMTAAHELGHCLGLFHPFPVNSTCSDAISNHSENPDTPIQRLPNFGPDLNISGLPDSASDNRDEDRTNGNTEKSCIHVDTSDQKDWNEGYMNVMDYANDVQRIGFFETNIDTMRSTLQNNEDLFGQVTITTNPPTSSSSSGSSLSTGALVGIIIGAVVGFILIVVGIVYFVKNPGKSHHSQSFVVSKVS